MSTSFRAFRLVRQTLALPVVLSTGVALMSAQAPATPASSTTGTSFNLQIPAHLDVPAFSSSSSSADDSATTSSAPDQVVAANGAEHFNFLNGQYGRRSYGRPRYRGGNTNEDGSEKYTFFAGAGLSAPTRDGNSDYLTESYGFQVGAGRNFNKKVGLNLQFDYDHFGFTGSTISGQSYLYFGDPSNTTYGLDGNSHIWSFTLNPTYTIYNGEGLGAYVVIGGGFYHKTAGFFVPVSAEGYDPYSGYPYGYTANETIDSYSSNAPGGNGGIGLTYKFSRFSNERFYAEARVVHTFNSYRPGVTASSSVAAINAEYNSRYNFFPQNSRETTYVPIKIGLRF